MKSTCSVSTLSSTWPLLIKLPLVYDTNLSLLVLYHTPDSHTDVQVDVQRQGKCVVAPSLTPRPLESTLPAQLLQNRPPHGAIMDPQQNQPNRIAFLHHTQLPSIILAACIKILNIVSGKGCRRLSWWSFLSDSVAKSVSRHDVCLWYDVMIK